MMIKSEGKTTRRWDMWKIQKQGKFSSMEDSGNRYVHISLLLFNEHRWPTKLHLIIFSHLKMWKYTGNFMTVMYPDKNVMCAYYIHTYTGAWRNNINNKYINIKALISNGTFPLHTAPSVILNSVEGYCTLKTYANVDTNVSSTHYKLASHSSYLQMSVPLNCTLFR